MREYLQQGIKESAKRDGSKAKRGKKKDDYSSVLAQLAGQNNLGDAIGAGGELAKEAARLMQGQIGNSNLAAALQKGNGGSGAQGGQDASGGSPEKMKEKAFALAKNSQAQALPPSMLETLEERLGYDLSAIKIHTDQGAIQAAASLGAEAFAHGADLYFSKGKPELKTLVHEVVHAITQGVAVPLPSTEPTESPKDKVKSTPSNEQDLERQADEIADSIAGGKGLDAPIDVANSAGPQVQLKSDETLSSAIHRYRRMVRLSQHDHDQYEEAGGDAAKRDAYNRIRELQGDEYAKAIETMTAGGGGDMGRTTGTSGTAAVHGSGSANTGFMMGDNVTDEAVEKLQSQASELEEQNSQLSEEDRQKASTMTVREGSAGGHRTVTTTEHSPTTYETNSSGVNLRAGSGDHHAELFHGRYADITASYSGPSASVTANFEAGSEEGEKIAALVQMLTSDKPSLMEAIRMLKDIDLSKVSAQARGELEVALSLCKGSISVTGAPLPFNIGSEAMLLDWLIKVSAGVYAKIYLSGGVDADLSNVQLNADGKAGAKAVAEAGAALATRATWMSGDEPMPIAEGDVEANVSAGASAEAFFTLKVGPGVLEIAAGAGVTWGIGASIGGKLRVSLTNTLKLAAKLLGLDIETLPYPLDDIWEQLSENGDALRAIIDLKDWILANNPLRLIADIFSAEQISDAIMSLIEAGVSSIDLVQYLRDNVQLGDEESATITIGDHTFESPIVWYTVAIGYEILELVQDGAKFLFGIGLKISQPLVRLLMEGGRVLLQLGAEFWDLMVWIQQQHPELWQIFVDAKDCVVEAIKFAYGLGRDYVLFMLDVYKAVGEKVFQAIQWTGEQAQLAIEFLMTASEPVLEWLKEAGSATIQALIVCGDWLVEVVQVLGNEVLGFLEEVAPELVQLGRDVAPVVVDAIKAGGVYMLQALGRLGTGFVEMLTDLGQELLPVWEMLKEAGMEAWQEFTHLYEEYGKPAIEFIQTLTADVLREVFHFIKDNVPIWKELCKEAFNDMLQAAREMGDRFMELLHQAAQVGAWVFQQGQNLTEPTMEVLRKHGPRFRGYLEKYGVPFLEFLEKAGDAIVEKILALGENIGKLFEYVGDRIGALVSALGGLIVEGFELICAVGRKAVDHAIRLKEGFVNWALAIGTPIYEWLKGAAATMVDMAVALGDKFHQLYNKGKEAFLDLLNKATEPLLAIWGQFRDEALVPALEMAMELGAWVIDSVKDLGLQFVNWAKMVGNEVLETLKGVGKEAIRVAVLLGDKFMDLYRAGRDALLDLLKKATEPLLAIWNQFQDSVLVPAIELAMEAGAWVLEHAKELGLEFVNWAKSLGQAAWAKLKTGIRQVVKVSFWLGEQAVEFIQNQWPTVVRLAKSCYQGLEAAYGFGRDVLMEAITLGTQLGSWAVNTVVTHGREALNLLTQAGTAIWDWIRPMGQRAGEFLIGLGRDGLQFFRQNIGEPLKRLIFIAQDQAMQVWNQYGKPGLDKVMRAINTAGYYVYNILKSIGSRIVSFIDKVIIPFGNKIKELGYSAIMAIVRGGEMVWNAAVDLGRNFIRWAKLNAPRLIEAIKGGVENLTRLVGQGFASAVDAVLTGVGDTIDMLDTAVRNPRQFLSNVAKGAWDGAKSAASWVGNKASSAASTVTSGIGRAWRWAWG